MIDLSKFPGFGPPPSIPVVVTASETAQADPDGLFKKPPGLLPMASRFWDAILLREQSQPHTPIEWVVLTLACQWLSEAELQLQDGKFVPAGIATDKFMAIATKFGYTPADREKAGIVAQKPKPAPRRKRSVDELTPDQITAKLQSGGVIETRVIPGMEQEPEDV